MDAVEFVEQWRRMDKNGYRKYSIFNDSPEDVIAEVEEWAKMNPVKTRQSEFLKQWPNAQFDKNGNIKVCPKLLMGVAPSNNGLGCGCTCHTCREDFWGQEVE